MNEAPRVDINFEHKSEPGLWKVIFKDRHHVLLQGVGSEGVLERDLVCVYKFRDEYKVSLEY